MDWKCLNIELWPFVSTNDKKCISKQNRSLNDKRTPKAVFKCIKGILKWIFPSRRWRTDQHFWSYGKQCPRSHLSIVLISFINWHSHKYQHITTASFQNGELLWFYHWMFTSNKQCTTVSALFMGNFIYFYCKEVYLYDIGLHINTSLTIYYFGGVWHILPGMLDGRGFLLKYLSHDFH